MTETWLVLAKTLGIALVAAFLLSWIAGRIVRFILFRLIVFAAVLAAGGLRARSDLQELIESRYRAVAENPKDDAAFRYLAGEVAPLLRKLGGQLPPAAEEMLREKAKSGSACHKALAKKALGEDADPVSACK